MNAGYLALLAVLIIVGGTIFGIASIFVLPIAGVIAAIAFAIWFIGREAQNKPPIE